MDPKIHPVLLWVCQTRGTQPHRGHSARAAPSNTPLLQPTALHNAQHRGRKANNLPCPTPLSQNSCPNTHHHRVPPQPGCHRARRRQSPPLMAAAASLMAAAGADLRSGGGQRPAGSTIAAAAEPGPGSPLPPSLSVTGRLLGPRMRA